MPNPSHVAVQKKTNHANWRGEARCAIAIPARTSQPSAIIRRSDIPRLSDHKHVTTHQPRYPRKSHANLPRIRSRALLNDARLARPNNPRLPSVICRSSEPSWAPTSDRSSSSDSSYVGRYHEYSRGVMNARTISAEAQATNG